MSRDQDTFYVVVYRKRGDTYDSYIMSSHATIEAAEFAASQFDEPGRVAQVEQHGVQYPPPELWVQRTLAGMEVGT